MERKEFTYKVGAVVHATVEELDNMIECSRTHYDWTCKTASAVGGEDGAKLSGFLTVWKEFHLEDGHELSSRELDLLCKILESPSAKPGLYERMVTILREVNDRWCEVMGKEKRDHDPIIHPYLRH